MLDPLEPAARARLESEILPRLLPAARWYRAKSRPLASVAVAREVVLGEATRLLWARCNYADGGPDETYLFPATADATAEATAEPAFHAALLRLALGGDPRPGSDGGRLVGRAGHRAPTFANAASRLLGLEQSNTSILFEQPSGRLFLKLYRQVAAGKNPDAELIAHLSERAGFTAVPAYVGALEYEPRDGGPAESIGLLQEFAFGRRDAWEVFVERGRSHLAGSENDAWAASVAAALGAQTAAMHVALASGWNDPATNAAALGPADFARLTARVDESLARLSLVTVGATSLPLPQIRAEHAKRLAAADGHGLPKTRVHGDFHLGQILLDDAGGAVFLDFEGEPARTAEERRRPQPPLFDVAGMIRSFAYAGAFAAGIEAAPARAERGAAWGRHLADKFLAAYEPPARAAGLLGEGDAWRSLLDALVLEKACYELAYELNNRPAWVPIPLAGIRQILERVPLS